MNSEKRKEIASNAPPSPKYLHYDHQRIETNERKPLETSVIDQWIITPAKQYYIAAKRLE